MVNWIGQKNIIVNQFFFIRKLLIHKFKIKITLINKRVLRVESMACNWDLLSEIEILYVNSVNL